MIIEDTKITADRFRGSLVGLAIGDALGAPLELSISGFFNPVSDMIDDKRSRIVKAGMWTDDTSMALCLAESIIENKEFDPQDQMKKYCKWYREGHLSSAGKCFGIGRSTEDALRRFERTGNPISGDSSPSKSGNGSLMRICPIPMAFLNNPKLAIQHSETSSKTTHAAIECVDSCKALSLMIMAALLGFSKENILSPDLKVGSIGFDCIESQKIKNIVNGSYKSKNYLNIKSSGYVADTLESALWAFNSSNDFKDSVLLAVNLGGDADTVGAVCGQLSGAFYGFNSIPNKWVEKISMKDKIISYSDKLLEFSKMVK